jgi:heme-degrading monooxygenase HmoA
MLARKVAARLKPNSLEKFTSLMENNILPWLREQEGFLDLITLALPDGKEVATITFWDYRDDVQAYSSDEYPAALKALQELLDGTPYAKTFEVLTSTFHRVDAGQLSRADSLARDTDSPQLDCR